MSKLGSKAPTARSIETHSSHSLDAARDMSFASNDVDAKRIAYSNTLIRESKALSDYIVGKRLSIKK